MRAVKFFGILVTVGIIILLIFNYRYPFVNPSVGNWSVGYHTSPEPLLKPDIKRENIISYEFIDKILPQKIDYIADPFFIKEKDTFYLFVELKGKGNADIALLTSANGRNYSFKGVVLDEPFHLSYPQVFRYKKYMYMLPETKGANNVLLYKASRFPYEWRVVDTLIKNKGIKDPSILLSEGLNLIVGVDDDLKQFMFTADSLNGEWKEVKNYKKRWGNETRPGGRFFKVKNDWFLPVQNRSQGYGTGISLYRLDRSSKQLEFKLADRMFLGPQENIKWFNRGMHHVDIQEVEDWYYMVYDGDRNVNGSTEFQYKRTIKFNLLDIYNLFN